jgi:hypothetical protein
MQGGKVMLVVYGNIYSDNDEHFNELKNLLTSNGYQIAYNSSYNATIIKEVVDEHEDTES